MATKIKIDSDLFERVCKASQAAGYASPQEFIVHVLEKEAAKIESAPSDADVTERLRGLGYLE